VLSGLKTFEIRENDRDFQVGDILILREFKPCKRCGGSGRYMFDPPSFDKCCESPHGKYTGRVIKRKIVYVLKDFFGLEERYVAMSIKTIKGVEIYE
jgi:hypothetical protein